ncbi:MAG: GxxExxY protein [Ignavibacteriaceae bacterium]|nr:GxxExxY protein [Ignavibacteriaceae bacterium]
MAKKTINQPLISEEVLSVIRCALVIHNEFSNGFDEVIYKRALAMELESDGILFVRDFEIPVYYRESQIGSKIVDFVVADKVSVEVKAIGTLEEMHCAQVYNYIKALNFETGLVLNFGETKFSYRIITNKKYNVKKKI